MRRLKGLLFVIKSLLFYSCLVYNFFYGFLCFSALHIFGISDFHELFPWTIIPALHIGYVLSDMVAYFIKTPLELYSRYRSLTKAKRNLLLVLRSSLFLACLAGNLYLLVPALLFISVGLKDDVLWLTVNLAYLTVSGANFVFLYVKGKQAVLENRTFPG